MPTHPNCPTNWPLASATVLLCGIWLSGPGALPARPAAAEQAISQEAADAEADVRDPKPARQARQPRAVPPVGWRRTVNGWERIPVTPPPARSINDQIARQLQRESPWAVHGLLEQVRRWNPLGLAAAEIGIACFIAFAAKWQATRSLVGGPQPLTAARPTPGRPVPRTN